MVKDINKDYGEVNSEDTVLSELDLTADKYVVSADSKVVKKFDPGAKQILVTDDDGNADSESYATPNKYVGTDENGKLELYQGLYIPEVAPPGRELVLEVLGNDFSAAALKASALTLSGTSWYEIEIAAAGGGGGGSSWRSGAHVDGSDGARGGWFNETFIVNGDKDSTIQYSLGTPGQGGAGPYHDEYKGDKTVKGYSPGGQGGKSPIVYSGVAGAAPVTGPLYEQETKGGPGLGALAGADGGGREQIGLGTADSYYQAAPTAGGGGANGPHGGEGATANYWSSYEMIATAGTDRIAIGGSGGAGGGLGLAGNGSYDENWPSKAAQGQGGGGGGMGTPSGYANAGYNSTGATAGAGGGGGGASKVLLTNIRLTKDGSRISFHELITGGGGGGAGASSKTTETGWQDNGGVTAPVAGGNNQDSNLGGGGTAGVKSSTYGNTTTTEVRGGSGGAAYIRIWRRY
jgi:hypothetical protein